VKTIVDLVAGARPNFMKLAPVMRAIRARGELVPRIIHTGQHYDHSMNDVFFEELGIPQPDVHLGWGRVLTERRLREYWNDMKRI